MKIIVCIKQILDPEIPSAKFKIDNTAKKAIPPMGDKAMVINPFDEQAVEAALRIKDIHGGNVTVLSLGEPSAKDVLKHAMAMGADEGILINNPDLEDYDSYQTAFSLSTAIHKIKDYDLIICGRQAGDWDNGQVGFGIAEFLGIPCVTPVQKIEIISGNVRVERVITDGYEILELPIPCLIAVSSELGIPRYATLPGIMAAAKKEITIWHYKDFDLDASSSENISARTKLLDLFIPVHETSCFFIEEESLEEAAVNLAMKLREDKIL